MRSILAGLRHLILPWGSRPSQPRLQLGPEIPPELQAFYTAIGMPVVAAILNWTSADSYYYDADLDAGENSIHAHARGFAANGIVAEFEFSSHDGADLVFADYGFSNVVQLAFGSPDRNPDGMREYFHLRKSQTFEVVGPIMRDGAEGRMLVFDPDPANATVNTNCNAVAQAVPGTQVVVPALPNRDVRWTADGTAVIRQIVADGCIGIVQLRVNGVAQAPQILGGGWPVGGRASANRTWKGTIPAGGSDAVLELWTTRAGGADGSARIESTHSGLSVEGYA